MQRYLIALAFCVLAGCATMSEEDCANADWEFLGEQDGAAGETYQKFDSRVERCAKFGYQADERAYSRGRDRGIERYCTPDNGYEIGRSGGAYRGACPADLEEDFLAEYNIGRRLNELSNARQASLDAYNNALSSLDSIKSNLRDARDRLRNGELTDEERAQIERDIDGYRREIDRLERDLPRLDSDVQEAEGRLDDYRQFLKRRGRRY